MILLRALMKHSDNPKPFTWWHSLMYATGILLLVCGLPGTLLLSLFFVLMGFDKSTALTMTAQMVVEELAIAGLLLFVACKITQMKQRA